VSREAAAQVLSGLLTNDVVLIDDIARSINEDYFTDPTLRSLYNLVLTYRSLGQGVLRPEAVEQFTAKSVDTGSAALLRELYDSLVALPVAPDLTRWAAHELRGQHERRLTQIAFRDSAEILSGSITEEGRNGQPGRTWAGAVDAREWLSARLSEINTEMQVSDAPAADVLIEGRAIIEDFLKAKNEDKTRRPMSGIPAFDELTGGLGKGLIMVAAPSGLGKTQLAVHLGYHASQMQGLHVYFATSETVRVTVRARLVARHSRHEKFEELREQFDLPYGLDSQKIDRGTLKDEHIPFLARVAIDWGAQGPTESEGSCFVAQMPHGMTMETLAAQINTRARVRKPDLVIIDYIALMASGRRLADKRQELSSLVQAAAHFSVDFNKGEGVPTVSPWQLNRESQKEMVRTGMLDTSGLAETAEAVNSAHLVVALSPDGARDGRLAGLRLNVLKNRDGLVLLGEHGIPMTVDYAASYFQQRVGAGDGGDPFDMNNNGMLSDSDASGLFSTI
jgi:replicative DNA helicase